MKIIKAKAEFVHPIDWERIMADLEAYGRVCYKSEDKITEESAERFIRGLIQREHESVLEHEKLTARFICDRGVSHELVRHRLASYSQESTRYCNYSKGKFGGELTFIEPCFWGQEDDRRDIWVFGMHLAEQTYKTLLEEGATPQEARSVLPNSLKTEVVMTANLREWRHFFRLRCAPAAHPQMREVAEQLLAQAYAALPVLFEDVVEEVGQ